jgi:hypothetical protein
MNNLCDVGWMATLAMLIIPPIDVISNSLYDYWQMAARIICMITDGWHNGNCVLAEDYLVTPRL